MFDVEKILSPCYKDGVIIVLWFKKEAVDFLNQELHGAKSCEQSSYLDRKVSLGE